MACFMHVDAPDPQRPGRRQARPQVASGRCWSESVRVCVGGTEAECRAAYIGGIDRAHPVAGWPYATFDAQRRGDPPSGEGCPLIVVDASALAEYLIDTEVGRRIGERLLADGDVHVPHLASIETASVIRGAVMGHQIDPWQAERALIDLRTRRAMGKLTGFISCGCGRSRRK